MDQSTASLPPVATPGSLAEMTASLATGPIAGADPVSSYKPVFKYADPGMLDADPTGEFTEDYGRRTGNVYSRDTVLELQVGGRAVSADELRKVEGGETLIQMARLKRSAPRRDFGEALSTGPSTDFIPLVSGLSSIGTDIKDMSKARDAMKKFYDQGPDSLSLQEKVWMTLFQENADRQAKQTWGGLVGTILRQMPAYGAGFSLIGAGMKGAEKAAGLAVKETAESAIKKTAEKMVKADVKRILTERTTDAMATGAKSIDTAVLQKIAQSAAGTVAQGSSAINVAELETGLMKVAQLQVDALANPKRFQGYVDFATEFAKRGFMDHGEDMFRGAAPGIKAKLREAAGVAFIEAPIKGGLYNLVDFAAVKPLVARAMGGTEAVTQTELQFSAAEDPAIRNNAKWLAFGSSWVEYASEMSGRSFNALFGIVEDVAKKPARAVARGALAAVQDTPVGVAFKNGGYVRRLLAEDVGLETIAETRAAISSKRLEAAKQFVMTDAGKALNMTAEQIATDSKLADRAVKAVMQANSDKAFFGFWLADKMSSKGWGPDTAGKFLRMAGYDEILGEFMEERYSGFAQGLFGLDSQSDPKDKSVLMDRLARAASGFFPETWGQATAELVSFAVPSATRAVINRAYGSIGAGHINSALDLTHGVLAFNMARGLAETDINGVSESGGNIVPVFTEVRKTQTAEEDKIEQSLGKVKADAALLPSLRKLVDNGVAVAMASGKHVSDQPGIGSRIARAALGMVDLAVTGNPGMLFNDPAEALMHERLGNSGKMLVSQLSSSYQSLFNMEFNRRVKADAATLEPGKKAANVLSSTDIESIDKAIRPALEAQTTKVIKDFLLKRGTMIVDKSDVDALVTGLRAENNGDLPGEWKGKEPEFRKALREKLVDTAKNNMSMHTENGQASFSVEKKEVGGLAAYVDRLIAPTGLNSYFNVYESASARVVDDMSSSPVDMATYALAASVKDPEHATQAEYQAIMAIINQTEISPDFTVRDGTSKANKNAVATARRITGVYKHLLSPTFRRERGGAMQNMRAVFNQETGEYSLGWLGTDKFKSETDLRAAAAAAGIVSAGRTEIVFTPFNNFFSEHAAAFAGLFHEYFQGDAHKDNPFLKRANEADGFAKAKAEDAKLRADAAAGDTGAQEILAGYDAAAEAVLKSHGVSMAPSPADPSKRGWLVASGALNNESGTRIYLPMKVFSAQVSLVEDAVESVDKRSPGVCRMVDVVSGDNVYRPAIRPFIAGVQRLLVAKEAELQKVRPADRSATDENLLAQIHSLIGIYDPKRYNGEAVSKAVAGITLYYADNAVAGIGRVQTEGALYRGLGLIAREARALPTYAGFVSTVSRMFGAPLIDNSNPMAASMTDLLPSQFLDGEDKALPTGTPVNSVAHVRNMQNALNAESRIADAFLKSKDVVAFFESHGEHLDAITPGTGDRFTAEDRIAIAADVRSLMNGGEAVSIVRPAAVAVNPAAKQEQAEPAEVDEAGKPSGGIVVGKAVEPTPNPDGKGAASLLQAISNPNTAKHMAAAAILLRSRPDVMARLGLKADRQIKMPGDDNYLKDAFSFYRTMYPGLPANAFDMFAKAFGEAPASDSSSAIDAPSEDSEASQVYDQDADGTEISVDASEEAADTVNEDTGDDAIAHPDYRANGVRESFAESFDVLFAKTLMQTVGNPYRGDSLAGHILDIYAADLNEDGSVDKDGIADLLSGDLGNKHPAFKEDTFRPWISAQYEQADRKTRAFLTVLETLGFERSLRFLTNARAVAVGGAVRLGNGQVSVMKRSAVADARDTVAEEMSSTLSDRNIRSVAIPKAVGVLTGIKAAHAAAKAANALVMLPPVTSMGARIAAVRARMLELVPAFDALFGEDNLLSLAFRDTSTHVNVARHALSGRHTSAADEWLVSSKGFPGFVVQRLAAAVEEFKLHEDVAVGSKAAVEKLFGDRVAVKDPSLRGAVNMMLNLAAGSNPLERVRTIDGRATVALSMPRMSILMKAIVNSPEFEQVARSYYGLADADAYNAAPAGIKNASDRAVQRMRRFGILPDGSPLFANDVGLRGSKGAKQGRPHPMAAKRELANAFSNPKGDGTTAVRLYSGDGNENSATYVVIPMQARSALIAADGTYDDLHAKVVEVSTLARLQAKRIKGFNNVAPALITGERTRVMHLVTADPLASKESKEADLGKTAVIGQVVDAARAYAGDKVSTGKWHIISDNEFYKSSTELLDAGAGKVQGLPDARKFIYTSLEDEWAASGAHQALFVGGDSLKVSVINNKTDGVLEGASLKPVPLVDWLRKNPGATQDTVVTWSGLGQVKLSDVIPGLKIEWVKPAGRTAGKLLKLSYDAELEFRVVANIDHGSDLVNNPMPKNLLREQANFPDGVSLTRAEYLALADVLDRKFRDAHPKTGKVNIRDWQVKALLDAGVLSHFSELVSKLTAATEVKRMITTKPTTYGVSAANAGQYVRMGADGMTVEAPYGAGDPLASGELRIPQAIADEYFDGITVDPALIRANADGGRPSFFIDTTSKAFVGHEYDQEFIADEVTARFIKLDGLRKVGDRSAYIRYLSTEIMPLLLDIDTEQPVESGRVYLFDDLFLDTKSWSGGKVFDRLALKYDSETRGNRAVGDKTRVVLGGSAFMMERTPSDPSSKICARLLGFVTPNAQSTSLFATMETNAAGKSKWSLRTQRNTDVEHAGAVVIDTPDAPVVTGHDYDGDKALLRFRDMFRAGLESSFADPADLDEMMTSNEPGIVNYVSQVTSANAKEAARSMNEIRRMVNNSVWSAEWTDARYRRFPADVRHGKVEDKDKVTLAAPFRFATTANPLSDEARGKLDAKFTPASYKFTDATQSAAASAEGYLTSQIRGVAVHATAIIKNLFGLYRAEVGLVNNGGAVISNVDGTPFMDNGNVMFKAAYGAIDQEGWEQTLHFQSMWTNALFDALKGDGFALRYGITMELATIHYFLMTAAQPRSQEEYDKFALAWADWANGPIGKAITAHAAATADEDYDGYAGADPVKSMKFDDRANLEMTLSNYGEQRYDALDHGDQSTVLAAAAAYVASGASYDEAASRTAGLVDLFTVIEAGRSMMRITETGYANLSTVRAVEKLGKNVKVAGDILSGDSLVSVNDPRARDLLLTRRDLAAKVVVDSYGVFRGTYEGSPLREYIAAKFGSNSGEATPSSRRFSLRPAVRESAMRAVYAIAITRMTPADVGAKLLEATPSDRGNRTTAFMRTVERMYRSMFAKYADDSSLAFSNRALNQLIVPRVDEGNNDIPSIMLGGDADSTLDEVTKGLDALRDWPATDTRLDFVENGVAFTPREMWHALRMYAAFVAMPTAAARRGSSSFIALFGTATMRELTDHQIVLTSDSDELAGVFELGFVIPSKWGEGRPKSVLRMDNVIPDIFPAAEKAAVSGSMPAMFTVKGKLGQDVKVYRDEAAGWMAQSGPEAVPITDAQAKAYYAKAASVPKVTANLLQFGGNVKKVAERAAELSGDSVKARPPMRTFDAPRRDVPVAMPRAVRPAPDAAPVDAMPAPVAVAAKAANPLSTKPAPVVNTVVNTGAIGRHVYLQDGSSFELNDGQYAANKAIVDMADGKYNEFVLSGPAGTGKTSVIAKSVSDIRQVNPGAEVVVASFTNTVARLIPGAMTIHKLLGMRRSQNIESFHADDLQFDGPSKKNNIPENGLIIIDEASMVGTELMQYIREAARDAGARILWAGDARQVAPINHKGPPPVFMADLPGAELTEVMRTSATNPLMKLFSRLRADQGTTNPGSQFSGETDVAGGSLMGYIAAKTYDDFMDAAVIAFRAATVNSPEGAAAVRIVAGTVNGPGAAVPAANKYIRDQLFPDNRGDFIIKGELLMGQAMIAADEGYAVENGMPYVVEAVGPMETSDRGIQVYPVSLKPMAGEDRTPVRRMILAPEGYVKFAETFQKLNKALWVAKKYGGREGVKAATAAYDKFIAGHLPRERVTNIGTDNKDHPIQPVIQNGYAQTVHKAQGSTVRDVFVMTQSIARFGFSHVAAGDTEAMNAQRDNNNRMLYTAATRAQQRVYALLSDQVPKTGYGAARVARSVMWTDAAVNAAGENLEAAKAVAAINTLSRTALTSTSYIPAFLKEEVRTPLTEAQAKAAEMTSSMLNDIRGAHGVKGTLADGILEAASRVSRVTGFDTAIVSGAFMASAAAIGISGDKSDGAKAIYMLLANRAGVGNAAVLDFLKSKAQNDFTTGKFTPAEFLFRYTTAFAGITGDIKIGEVVGALVEKTTASLTQQTEFDFGLPKGPKAQKLSEMSLSDMRYHRNRALEDVRAYGPAVEGPYSLEHDDPKWAFAVKKLAKANASLARLNPYIAGVLRKTPSQAGFFTDTTASLTQEDRAANAAAAQAIIAKREAAYAGADDILALGQRQLPENMVNADGSPAMGPADREQAARMSRSAVGFTPDRGGQVPDNASEYVKRIREVLDQSDWLKRPEPMTEAEKREARGGDKRKEASPDTYSESAVGLMKAMMSENAGAGMREYSDYIRLAISSIRDDGNPQASRIADLLEKALFRDVNGNPAPLQWYSAPGNADRMLDLLKQSGNTQSRVLYVLMREEDAETDPTRKAALARSRAMASKALAVARIWVNASREPEMESQRVAIEAQAAGHPAADLTDAAKAALEYYTRLQPAVMSELDPETMAPDAWNRFHVLFADTDVFFSGAVMPFFRGGDVRSILLNKQALVAIPDAFKTGNFLTMLLAAGNDKGTILKLKKIKGAPWKADGKGGYEDVPEAQRSMQTRFQRGTVVRDAINDSFTQEEFATARFMLDAAHAYLGDGGASAKLPISGSPSFRDMSGAGDVDLSYKAALQRVHGIKADANGNIQRPWSLDILLTNAHNNLTEALYQKVEDTVKEAYKRFRDATGKVAEREMKALEWMEQAGYANIRTQTGARGETHLVSTAMTIPVKAIEEVFNASTAKVKLLANGREAADMTLSAMADLARQSFRNITANAGANMSWLLSDSIAPLHDIGRDSPFFQGTGYHSYWSKVMNRAPLPEYTARMRERFDNLRGMAESCFDDKTGEAFSVREADFRSARMLKFYADLFLRQGDPLRDDPAGLTAALASKSSPHYLGANATMWTMATKIYAECARRIHETAMADGTVEDLVLGDVPLAVFNAAIDSVSASRDLGTGRQGMTWSEIYKADGALPRNLGIDEALTQYAQGTATAVRYRMALNQAMLAADENGMPLIYAEPGTDATETIPDRMWAMTARWWAEVHGEAYDNTKSGRENAAELYKKIVPGKHTESGKQESNLGVRRYIFKQVKLPAKCSVFARVSAAADRMDDDTKGTLTAWAGGEAASVMAQILAVPGYGHPGAALAGVNRTLSWSKSLSVMCSLFFPIATAFESPVAAVGFWPTVFGLTKGGSDAARRMTAGQGMVASAAKKAGLEAGAPFMADIMKLIGSDDHALVELKVHAILAGLTLSDRSKNMTDHDRTVIAQDIKRLTSLVTNQFNHKTGKFVKSLLEGAMEESSELAFEYVINATKLAVFAQMNNKLRNRAIAQGRWWDPIRSMKEWAPYINAEVGGIDPAIYPWATPAVQQIMKTLLFSWEWTLGAWEAGGGNVLTQKFFGMTSSPTTRNFMFGRWFRMVTGVMIGIPVGMQVLMTAMGKAAGGDDETKNDKWFNWQNEQDRKVKDFDITPMLRAISKVPHLVDLKRAYPVAMSLVPALTGDEGDMVSSRKRRYYAHMGKQGWEVMGWFQDPMKSLLGKMSMPVQRTMEGVFGINPSMGWEKEWKDLGFWERWLTTKPEDSAALGMLGAFVPFSFAGMSRSPEAGFLNTIMPIGKGMSKTRAEKEMAAMFKEWGDDKTYAGILKARPEAYNDLRGMAGSWLYALKLNGYDADRILKDAVAAARKPLYEKVHAALPYAPGVKPDMAALEEAANGLNRLEFTQQSLIASIKLRDKGQNIQRVGDLRATSSEALKLAFSPRKFQPKGGTQDAELGGDVRGFLATDEVPATMLGYKVLKTEELSPEDLQYFKDNPEAAGHFDMNQRGAK